MMKQAILNYGLIRINGEWQLVNNANIATMDEDALLLNFNSEEERQQYVDDNNISISVPDASGD
jgi:hypothetical protein